MKGRKHVFYFAFSFSASWKADVMAGALATMSGHGIVVTAGVRASARPEALVYKVFMVSPLQPRTANIYSYFT